MLYLLHGTTVGTLYASKAECEQAVAKWNATHNPDPDAMIRFRSLCVEFVPIEKAGAGAK